MDDLLIPFVKDKLPQAICQRRGGDLWHSFGIWKDSRVIKAPNANDLERTIQVQITSCGHCGIKFARKFEC